MARKGRKKAAVESPLKPKTTITVADNGICKEQQQAKERWVAFSDSEAERRIFAIQAIRDAEIASLLAKVRLFHSYFSKEQLKMPALKFFQENCPNLLVKRNEQHKVYELAWNDDNVLFLQENYAGGNVRNSIGNNPTTMHTDGFQFSAKSVRSSFLDVVNLQVPNFVLDEASDINSTRLRDVPQTPGETCGRLSFGMTPKTTRLPKKGEMLLSVRGSPLGVYEEENLEVIRESEDGSLGMEA